MVHALSAAQPVLKALVDHHDDEALVALASAHLCRAHAGHLLNNTHLQGLMSTASSITAVTGPLVSSH